MAQLVNAQYIWDLIANNVEPNEELLFSNDTDAALYELYKNNYYGSSKKQSGEFEVPEKIGDLLGNFIGMSYSSGFYQLENSQLGVSSFDNMLTIAGDEDLYNALKIYPFVKIEELGETIFVKDTDYQMTFISLNNEITLTFGNHLFALGQNYTIDFGSNQTYACLHCSGNVTGEINSSSNVNVDGSPLNYFDGAYDLLANPIFNGTYTLIPYSTNPIIPPVGYSYKGKISKSSEYEDLIIPHNFESLFTEVKLFDVETGNDLSQNFQNYIGKSTSSITLMKSGFENLGLTFGQQIHYAIISHK